MLVVGQPSMKAAEQLKLLKEAHELNLNNIIASEGTEYSSLVTSPGKSTIFKNVNFKS